jgi:4-hydroxybenzoyl-CoA thioesterase
MTAAYRQQRPIRFADVDWARVLYFPKQLDLLHSVMEDFFRDVVGVTYADMLQRDRIGFPTVHLECDFRAPLRFGEQADVALTVVEIGKRKVVFRYDVTRAATGELTGVVVQTTVAIDPETFRSIELPPKYREALGRLVEARG